MTPQEIIQQLRQLKLSQIRKQLNADLIHAPDRLAAIEQFLRAASAQDPD